jgi:PST family polysaccharide transporter
MLRNVYLMAYCLDGAMGAMRNRMLRDGIYALAVLVGSLVGARFGLAGVASGVVAAIVVNYLVGAAMSLRMLGATWRDYARSQLPAFGLGLLAGLIGYLVRWGLLAAGAGQLVVLMLTGGVTLGVLLALYLVRPEVIGQYGRTAVRHLQAAISARFPPRQAA